MRIFPKDGGAPLYTFQQVSDAFDMRWRPDGKAIQYGLTRNGAGNIWEQPLAGGDAKQVTKFRSGTIFGFEWSPDGKKLAIARGERNSNVVLISNFR
jgi:Tol biopolymer transport system component